MGRMGLPDGVGEFFGGRRLERDRRTDGSSEVRKCVIDCGIPRLSICPTELEERECGHARNSADALERPDVVWSYCNSNRCGLKKLGAGGIYILDDATYFNTLVPLSNTITFETKALMLLT